MKIFTDGNPDFSYSAKRKFFLSSLKNLYVALLIFRLLNAWIIQTSYVPDEYWQSTEVAHKMIFGYGYLTWEWKVNLRSYTYPALFAIYFWILQNLHVDYRIFIVKGPRLMQAILASLADLYTYRLSLKLSGSNKLAQWTLFCQLTSWFLFYTSTRTLTNSVEGSLTAIALYYYPWPNKPSQKVDIQYWPKYITIISLSFVLRPTSAIFWFPLCLWHFTSIRNKSNLLFWRVFKQYIYKGSFILVLSLIIDRSFYGHWTNVFFKFFEFNVLSNFSNIYGTHSWHWYISQGLPVVLGTHLIIILIGLQLKKLSIFFFLIAWNIFCYSLIGHKEFRFLSSILPFVMHICGSTLHYLISKDIHPITSDDLKSYNNQSILREIAKHNLLTNKVIANENKNLNDQLNIINDDQKIIKNTNNLKFNNNTMNTNAKKNIKTVVMLTLILFNIPLAFYTCLLHQRGTVDVIKFLSEHNLKESSKILFLMPCHSTPFYSYFHRNISLEFLTCEPNLSNQLNYIDEADFFYNNPITWINKKKWFMLKEKAPSILVMFDVLYDQISEILNKLSYKICARFFHTHFPEGRIGSYVYVLCQ